MAKIMGNIVGLPSPRSDWNQTDEMKADFIKNKPVEAISLQHYGDSNIVPTDSSFFTFETNDETMEATITRYIGAETSVVIPYEYKVNGKTYKITKSAELAFLQSSISEAIFPKGFKEFGGGDFVQSQLRKIVIPKSVSMLGTDMFFDSQLSIVYYMGTEEQWKSLESKSYAPLYMGKVVCLGEGNVIPVSQKYVESLLASGNDSPEEKINSLQYYGNADISPSDSSLFGFTPLSDGKSVELGSMGYPGELRGELVIPYALDNKEFLVTEIMHSGFWGFGGTKVTFPSCVKTIRGDAFYDSSVEEIVFCGQPDKIMAGAFFECTSLKKVYFKGTQAEWEAIVEPEGNDALLNATVYFEYTDVSKAYVDKKTESGSGGGGSDAEAINILKYYGDVNITPSPSDLFFVNETYGDGVAVSSNNAPDTLTGELVIPYEIEYNGNRCKVTKIFDGGFWGARIEKLIIPSTVKEIGTYAFSSATGIKEIVFCGKTIDIGAESLGNSENMDIYYRGSQKEWDTNVTGKENIPQSATIHYLWT